MRTRVIVLAGLLGFLALGVCLGQGKKPAAKPQAPLIRMDLIKKQEGDIAVVKRDIFVPQSAVPVFAGPTPAALHPGVKSPMPEAKPVEEAPQEVTLNLRYMGYIQGGQNFLALVLFENQASAVGVGELIGQAWKVIRVEAAEIEVQGQDGKTYKFALEGERK